ncbi:hypothetical protein ACIQBJ_00945 [Kitasatospora sp. NPDC088391]|uniref:hypothetical protein n=1 Tax=Kitasatospora sp. NPDC088391 TaxID=3364074 RepID=UPI00380F2B0C
MGKWAWVQFEEPWRHEDLGGRTVAACSQYGYSFMGMMQPYRTFDTAGRAGGDLRLWLQGKDSGQAVGYGALAALLTGDVTGGEFLLWDMKPPRAWLVFQVPDGVDPAEAALVVHQQWKPQAYEAFVRSSFDSHGNFVEVRKSGVWAPRRDSTVTPPAGGCAAALMLVICAIVLLLF